MNTRTENNSGTLQQSNITPTRAIDIAHSVSVNTIPTLNNEYLLNEAYQGFRYQGNMSNVRRFFCLFVTFDLLFIGLIWLICIMLHGENIWQGIDKQIKHYDIKTSLFDLLSLALCRFILIWLFYGIIQINHWIIIFITTTTTCIFSIIKVFYYDWQQTSQPVFEVLIVLTSFILAWGEAWFLDYRVIPKESYADQILNPAAITTNERSPLIRHYLRSVNTPSISRYTVDSVENFQSPMNTPEGSIRDQQIDNKSLLSVSRIPPYLLNKDEVDKYEIEARLILDESTSLFQSNGWILDKEINDEIAHYMTLPNGRKIFKIQAIFNTIPKNMLQELYYEVENIPNWNKALINAQRIHIFNEFTDILYQVSAEAAAGLISSRDFVSLRYWTEVENDSYVIATKATIYPGVPKNNKYVRGENGVTCLFMEPVDTNHCKLQLILNTNLKGWLPQGIVDLAIIDTLFDYVKCLKIHINKKYNNEV